MAKKKGRRASNVARKREKRNRDRKSRQKQLAIAKQRRLPYGKSEEEHLHACISQSRKLLDEPEFDGLLFDFELMYTSVTEVLDIYNLDEPAPDTLSDAVPQERPDSEEEAPPDTKPLPQSKSAMADALTITESKPEALSESEQACEHFRSEVLRHLVTQEFMQRLGRALSTCETRLRLTGNREFAEVASVTRSLFEAAPPEILTYHPMIQTIGIETLRILVEEPDIVIDRREEVSILSDVLEHEDSERCIYETGLL